MPPDNLDEIEGPELNAPEEHTSQEKSLALERLRNLGGRAVEGIKNTGSRIGGKAQEIGGNIREGVHEFRDKRRVVSQGGLREDYSVKLGSRKRYWLDDNHYIVFNPNDPDERELAEQAIQDYRLYGSVEGEQGDANEVIEAGEAEMSAKKLNRDPLIAPGTSARMERAGKYLANAPIVDPIPSAFGDDDDDDIGTEGIDMDEDFIQKASQRRQSSGYQPIIPQQMKGRVSKSDSEMFGRSRIPTDREMFGGAESLVPRIRGSAVRDQEQHPDNRPRGPVKYVIPKMSDILPRIDEGYNVSAAPARKRVEDVRPAGPVKFVIPSMDNILPRIYQDPPVTPQKVVKKPTTKSAAIDTPAGGQGPKKPPRAKKVAEKKPRVKKPAIKKSKPKPAVSKSLSTRKRREQKKTTKKKVGSRKK